MRQMSPKKSCQVNTGTIAAESGTILRMLFLLACAPSSTPDNKNLESAFTDSRADSPPVDSKESQLEESPVESKDSPKESVDSTPVVDTSPPSVTECFADIGSPLDYAQFSPVMNSKCMGTNYQTIQGIQRVVFVGDSVTVGTPPTATSDWYRNVLAEELANRYGLEKPGWDWQNVNLVDGTTYVQQSGDFMSCAKYGARTDDLLLDPHRQLLTCLPEEDRGLTTLVVMTTGGNDLFSMLQDVQNGVDEATVRATWDQALVDYRDAVHYVKDDATMFPGGLYFVFANIFDLSDAEGAEDMARCEGAVLIGMDDAIRQPLVWELVTQWQTETLRLAIETGSDMVFMGEAFCGHGSNFDNSAGRCYRAADAANWYDFTCEHPNDLGHAAIAELVLSVVDE